MAWCGARIYEDYFTIEYDEIQIDFPDGLGRVVLNSDDESQLAFTNYIDTLFLYGFSKTEIYVILDGLTAFDFNDFIDAISQIFWGEILVAPSAAWKITKALADESELKPCGNKVYKNTQLVKTLDECDFNFFKERLRYDEEDNKLCFYNGDHFVVDFDASSCKELFISFVKYLKAKGKSFAEIYVAVDGLGKIDGFSPLQMEIKHQTFLDIEAEVLRHTDLKAVGNDVMKNGKSIISFRDQTAREVFPNN